MKRIVEISDQVLDFLRSLAPEPRRLLRSALRDLEQERGDLKALEGPLSRFWRLRVGGYRVIFAYTHQGSRIRCVFAERRPVVYAMAEEALRNILLARERGNESSKAPSRRTRRK